MYLQPYEALVLSISVSHILVSRFYSNFSGQASHLPTVAVPFYVNFVPLSATLYTTMQQQEDLLQTHHSIHADLHLSGEKRS